MNYTKSLILATLAIVMLSISKPVCGQTPQTGFPAVSTGNSVVYGKRFYAVCDTWMTLRPGSKSGYINPEIHFYAFYNPSPGLGLMTNASSISVKNVRGDEEIPLKGKADFEVLAIDKLSRGYNADVGKCIGVLGETGKYFAVKAKVHYDGSKEKSKQLTAKYKIILIDKEKYQKKHKW